MADEYVCTVAMQAQPVVSSPAAPAGIHGVVPAGRSIAGFAPRRLYQILCLRRLSLLHHLSVK